MGGLGPAGSENRALLVQLASPDMLTGVGTDWGQQQRLNLQCTDRQQPKAACRAQTDNSLNPQCTDRQSTAWTCSAQTDSGLLLGRRLVCMYVPCPGDQLGADRQSSVHGKSVRQNSTPKRKRVPSRPPHALSSVLDQHLLLYSLV